MTFEDWNKALVSGTDEQKDCWMGTPESGLLASKIMVDEFLDPEHLDQKKTKHSIAIVIGNYYLRLIPPGKLAGHIQIEGNVPLEMTERMASKVVENVQLA